MSIDDSRSGLRSGVGLVEFLVAIAVGSLLLLAVMSVFAFSNRSFVALGNYVMLDRQSRSTLDRMTQEIRMTSSLNSWNTNWLFFNTPSGSFLAYWYDPYSKRLYRWRDGQLITLLGGCTTLNFDLFQRTPKTNFGNFNPTYGLVQTTCKMIQMNWICTTNILGTRFNTESVQSAKVVIRNQ